MGRIAEFLFGPALERTGMQADVVGLTEYAMPAWYMENLGGAYGGGRLADRVWVANRCQQMNAQQLASMPLRFHGPDGTEPAWLSNPDPEYFPNGLSDALHYAYDQMYGWGYAILLVTNYYADGYPRYWTVMPSCEVTPVIKNGQKIFKLNGGGTLNPNDVVQIDRNPGPVHGTSALRAYSGLASSLNAAEQQATVVGRGGYPTVYLQPKRSVSEEQAEKIQARWMQRTAERGGAPPVVPPDIDVHALSINPADLQLLESRAFDARAICTAYGVPSVLMNMAIEGGMTYQNPAALGEFWWRFELRNVATRFENALSNRMLPRGQFVTIDSSDTWSPAISESDDPQAANENPEGDAALTAPTAATPSGGSQLAAVK